MNEAQRYIRDMTPEKVDAMTPEQFGAYMELVFDEVDRHLDRTTPRQRMRWFLDGVRRRDWALDLGISTSRVGRVLARQGFARQAGRFRRAAETFGNLDDFIWARKRRR